MPCQPAGSAASGLCAAAARERCPWHCAARGFAPVHHAVAVQVGDADAQLVHEVLATVRRVSVSPRPRAALAAHLHGGWRQRVGRSAAGEVHELLQVRVQIFKHLRRSGAAVSAPPGRAQGSHRAAGAHAPGKASPCPPPPRARRPAAWGARSGGGRTRRTARLSRVLSAPRRARIRRGQLRQRVRPAPRGVGAAQRRGGRAAGTKLSILGPSANRQSGPRRAPHDKDALRKHLEQRHLAQGGRWHALLLHLRRKSERRQSPVKTRSRARGRAAQRPDRAAARSAAE